MKTVSSALAIALALTSLATAALAVPTTVPLKWSQPIYQIGTDPTGVPLYWGWDQPSWAIGQQPNGPQAADDWRCRDQLPVTDFHWWGSYIDKLDPIPQARPMGFWFGIYKDIPVGPGQEFSMPGDLIWQYVATSYEEQFVGYDVIESSQPIHDATFQYNVYLPQTHWFYQPGSDEILWLSIVALYQPGTPMWEWGWKTRPHFFQDDAVFRNATQGWMPLYGPDGLSWDLAFEISTIPEPGSAVALLAGFAGIAGLRLRRRR